MNWYRNTFCKYAQTLPYGYWIGPNEIFEVPPLSHEDTARKISNKYNWMEEFNKNKMLYSYESLLLEKNFVKTRHIKNGSSSEMEIYSYNECTKFQKDKVKEIFTNFIITFNNISYIYIELGGKVFSGNQREDPYVVNKAKQFVRAL